MSVRKRHISTRPADEPISTSPTGMDFEKRELLVTQVAGVTVQAVASPVASAIVTYEDVAVSHNGSMVYKL